MNQHSHTPSDKSIVARVGRLPAPEVEFIEFPSAFEIDAFRSTRVVVPAPPPYCGEAEPANMQPCPYCRALIPIDDDGISYCPRCLRILFIADGVPLLEETGYREFARDPECPACCATSNELSESIGETTIPSDHWDRHSLNGLLCRYCGHILDIAELPRDGYQFHRPGEDAEEL